MRSVLHARPSASALCLPRQHCSRHAYAKRGEKTSTQNAAIEIALNEE